MAGPPMEPSAANRQFAHALREMFVALIAEGFTRDESLTLIAHVLKAKSGES